jgi:superfamily I DNA/RNA helicase
LISTVTISTSDNTLLRGTAGVVGVEAGAGAGKTHNACIFALEIADSLPTWQQVLFLSHTNAARNVFRERIGTATRNIHIRTLDAFVLEVLSPYATLFNLPDPLRPPLKPPGSWFADACKKCRTLLRKKQMIAEAIVARFPVVIADEHQDASIHQHEILMELNKAGARVRCFGDALQAILIFDNQIPGWNELMGPHPVVSLSGTWRWVENPELGAWIHSARQSLVNATPIPLRHGLPDCVDVVTASEPISSHWTKHPTVVKVLQSLSREERLIVVTRSNKDAQRLAALSDLNLTVYEGMNPPQIEDLLYACLGYDGKPIAILNSVLEFAQQVGTLTPEFQQAIRALVSGTMLSGLTKEVREVAAAIQAEATLLGALRALRLMFAYRAEIPWRISSPATVTTLRTLPLQGLTVDNVRDLLYQAKRMGQESVPERCSSTIHKVKGLEFAHVVIPWLASSQFELKPIDRQLLYVALSRATGRLTLVAPETRPSPLIAL